MPRIWAIGDPHLSRAKPKPMDVFGIEWTDHAERIFTACRERVAPDDLLILAGDISWATRLEEARPDLEDIGSLPGRKLLLKGNHDFWWQSRSKVEQLLDPSVSLLQNDSHLFGDIAIAGGRGWSLPGDAGFTEDDAKMYRRELERLRLSFASLAGKSYGRLLAVTHFPPLNARGEDSEVTQMLEENRVDVCIYGHLHGNGRQAGFDGLRNGVRYKLLSADAVGFAPIEVAPSLFAMV